MNALDLFGGRDAVVRRLTGIVAKAIGNSKVADVSLLEEAMLFPPGTLAAIHSKKEALPLGCIDALISAFGINIDDALGKPDWRGDARQEWERKIEHDGVVSTGPEVTPELYVYCKALSELKGDDR